MATKKSTTPNRSFKVADQIQRDLTELIARELKDPRVGMVTIQAVEVTPDYAHAKVFFSLLVGDSKACEEGLNQAAGFLRIRGGANPLDMTGVHPETYPVVEQIIAKTGKEGLNQAAGFLRAGLFKRLHIHTVPTLHFIFDRTTERAADMNALIARAVSSRAKED